MRREIIIKLNKALINFNAKERFIHNLVKALHNPEQYSTIDDGDKMDIILRLDRCNYVSDVINCAFLWDKTNEGVDYWEHIFLNAEEQYG